MNNAVQGIVCLDRDGVINRNLDDRYVSRWVDFEFLPGVCEALRLLAGMPFDVYVVSNQAGVGKGLMTRQQLDELTQMMLARIVASGGRITDVLYCPHAPDAGCECRKPKPGLLRQVLSRYRNPPEYRVMIGDSERDLCAGRDAGYATGLILTGKTATSAQTLSWRCRPDFIVDNLSEAVQRVRTDWGKG